MLSTGLILLVSLGCRSEKKNQEKIWKDISHTADELSGELAKLARSGKKMLSESDLPASTVQELQKLRQIEYHVPTFPADTAPEKLAAALNLLGRDRWDCVQMQELENDAERSIAFLCKRPVDTPLRYVPKGIIAP